MPPEYLPELDLDRKEVVYNRQWLVDRIMKDAEVRSEQEGYIFWEGLNHLVDPQILKTAGKVIGDEFLSRLPKDRWPTKTMGVSNRGRELGTALGMMLDMHITVTDREVDHTHRIRGLRPGDRILVGDDFCAYGNVANAFNSALLAIGVEPIFAFVVAKDFGFLDSPQEGYREFRKQGFPAFAVLRVTGMKGGRVVATAEDI